MHHVKALDLISLRKSLAESQPLVLDEIRSRMQPELRAVLDKTVASSWLPEPQICAIFGHVCKVLFPGMLAPHVLLGRHMALKSYRGVYRIFLSIPSTSYVMKQAAGMWASYHSTGKAAMEDVTAQSAVLVVRGADPISRAVIDVITGHVVALAELTGAKDPLVAATTDDPAALRWSMRWK
ncbi:MAG TPA: hypothetical protein VLT33_02100 [Labilithrix sp.]|nr:hypothetical protein [Labilithrix sp.]